MKSPLRTLSRLLPIVLLGLLAPSLALAGELLKLVAPESMACLQVRNLKAQAAQLESSEFAHRLQQHPLFQTWVTSKDFLKLQEVRPTLEAIAGKPLRQLADELLGQDVVLALYAAPGADPQLVVLLDAENSASLDAALNLWRQVDQAKLTTLRHREVDYTQITPASGKTPQFYVRFGQSLAVSESESLIQRTIDVSDSAAAQDSFWNHSAVQTALQRRTPQDVATLYVNPRGWDSLLLQADNGLPAVLADAWKRCRMLSFRLTHKDDIALTMNADYDNRDAATWWQSLTAATSTTDLAVASNSVALAAASGRLQGAGLAELGRILRSSKSSQDADKWLRISRGLLLGLDPIDDVLPQLGPHWSVMIVPRPEVTSGVPLGIVAAIDLSPSTKTQKVTIQSALENAFTASLNMAAAARNAQGKTETVLNQKPLKAGTLRWLSPIGWIQPSVIVTPQSVLLATSPELCEWKLSAAPESSVTDASSAGSPRPMSSGQAITLNIAGSRALLNQQRNWLLKQAVRSNLTPEKAELRVRDLDEFLKLLDGAYLTLTANGQTVEATLGIVASRNR